MTGTHDWDDDEIVNDVTESPTDADDASGDDIDPLMARPAPPGLSRRDRKAWREIEAERIAAAIHQRRSMEGYRGGFPAKPPRGLGRRGVRAFRAADRANRQRWWERKRGAQEDQAVGVLVLVLLLLAGVVVFMLTRGGGEEGTAAPVDESATAASSPAATSSQIPASALAGIPPTTQPRTTDRASREPVLSASGRETPSEAAAGVFGNGTNVSTPPATTSVVPPGVVTVRPTAATVEPDPGSIGAVPASAREDAVTAAKSWFGIVCGSTFTEEFAARYTATKAAMTPEAWAYADPARDVRGRQWWESVVAGRETRTCTKVQVSKFAGPAPAGPDQVPVVLTAERQVTSDISGRPARNESISELRTMARGSDGLWSVGPVVMAG